MTRTLGLVDCANWTTSATWQVPADATSGIYFAHAVREDGTPGESHIVFIVRDDDGRSDVLFQTSDTTWQAYNRYGGFSLYTPDLGTRAKKVSYNRPFTTRSYSPEDWLFNAEYPMIRWLERNAYDVSYFTGVDSDRRGGELAEHRSFLSVGHDEYWSGQQRANVEAARGAGVHMAFLSGNEVFWKTRWEDGHRTLVTYKETLGDAVDPSSTWTGTWRDERMMNSEGPNPENALTGTIFKVNDGTSEIEVPAADGRLRLWRNTSLAGLAGGDSRTLGSGTLGYEWDADLDNGARPAGLVRLSTASRSSGIQVLLDQGANYGSGSATHHLTLYRHASGALVFGAGTVQWAWGLDPNHDRGSGAASPEMQQAMVNLFADMDVQPGGLQPGLAAAAASTDYTPPTSQATSISLGNPATAGGVAADTGGGRVGAVEVSTDGGASWHPAEGRESWTYSWVPPVPGAPVTVLTRAADDSANLVPRTPGPGTPPAGGGGAPGGGGGGGGTGGGSTCACGPGAGNGGGAAGGPGTGAGAGGSGSTPTPVARNLRVRVGPSRVRVSRSGGVKLRVRCSTTVVRCNVRLRLFRGRRLAGERRVVIAGRRSVNVTVKLNRATRRKLTRARKLRVTAVAIVRDAAGNRLTSGTPIRLLAPNRS